MVAGEPIVLTLFFQRYRFSVKGAIQSATRLQTGVQKVRIDIEFSPELVTLLSEYFEQAPPPNGQIRAARA